MTFTADQVLFLNEDGVYGAAELGLPFGDLISEGIVVSTDFAVSQRGAGANMSVDVAAGACWVKGDYDSNLQPTYRYREAALQNVAVSTADPTNPRKDLVVAEVLDSTFSGASDLGRVRVITGTPAPSPSEPALPNSCLKLAMIDVAAGATSITNANITDKRRRATVGGGKASGGLLYEGTGTSAVTVTSNNEALPTTVLTASALYFDGATEIEVEFYAPFVDLNDGAGASLGLCLWDGATNLGRIFLAKSGAAGDFWYPCTGKHRLTPSEGVHTFAVKGFQSIGNALVMGGAGGAGNQVPMRLSIRRVN